MIQPQHTPHTNRCLVISCATSSIHDRHLVRTVASSSHVQHHSATTDAPHESLLHHHMCNIIQAQTPHTSHCHNIVIIFVHLALEHRHTPSPRERRPGCHCTFATSPHLRHITTHATPSPRLRQITTHATSSPRLRHITTRATSSPRLRHVEVGQDAVAPQQLATQCHHLSTAQRRERLDQGRLQHTCGGSGGRKSTGPGE